MKPNSRFLFLASVAAGAPRAKLWRAVLGLTIVFISPVIAFIRFAGQSTLYSYELLVPAVSLFFIWHQKDSLRESGKRIRGWAWIPFATACGLLAWYWLARKNDGVWLRQDYLALMLLSWLFFVYAACLRFLDTGELHALVFPLGFLVFMVPLPVAIEAGLETFLQHGSALAARLFFSLAGTPYVYENLTFNLPAFNMHVAPECSGVHSSSVLFITSVVAAHLFLRSTWKRMIFVFAVVPLGLLRNGFRVFVIGELCVRVGPEMSDSWIHHHGGPVFFLLSLIPLFLLLYFLIRAERRTRKQPQA